MKVLVAPNSMKGSLSCFEFAEAIYDGLISSGLSDIVKIPVADGGDGTSKVIAHYLNANFHPCVVKDPLGRSVESGFYLNEDKVAFIEMASSSGLKLLKPEEYSVFTTSSFGVGQLINFSIEAGAKKILLGVGGSATVDGGMGAMIALGVKFYNRGEEITLGNGKTIGSVTMIDYSNAENLLKGITISILSDVKNPLLGENGASHVFARQKGASKNDVLILEKNLSLFSGAIFQASGRDISGVKGGGAAGGIAASFNAFFGAEIVDGAEFILNLSGFYKEAEKSDLIITGEGIFDETSFSGKVTGEIVKFGMEIDKEVIVICGRCNLNGKSFKMKAFEIVNDKVSLNESIRMANDYIYRIAKELGERIKDSKDI